MTKYAVNWIAIANNIRVQFWKAKKTILELQINRLIKFLYDSQKKAIIDTEIIIRLSSADALKVHPQFICSDQIAPP